MREKVHRSHRGREAWCCWQCGVADRAESASVTGTDTCTYGACFGALNRMPRFIVAHKRRTTRERQAELVHGSPSIAEGKPRASTAVLETAASHMGVFAPLYCFPDCVCSTTSRKVCYLRYTSFSGKVCNSGLVRKAQVPKKEESRPVTAPRQQTTFCPYDRVVATGTDHGLIKCLIFSVLLRRACAVGAGAAREGHTAPLPLHEPLQEHSRLPSHRAQAAHLLRGLGLASRLACLGTP